MGRLAWSVKGVVWCVTVWGNWHRRKGTALGFATRLLVVGLSSSVVVR